MSDAFLSVTAMLPLAAMAGGKRCEYSPELAAQLLERIANGEAVPAACRELGMDRGTPARWRMQHREFADAYKVACELRGEAEFERHGSVIDDTLAGAVDPKAASAVLRAIEWRAMVLNRTLYGQKQEVAVSGGLTLGINTRWPGKTIEGERAA